MQPTGRYIVPQFEERTAYGYKRQDPYNKLFEDRIIFLGAPVDDTSADDIMAQLIVLESGDPDPTLSADAILSRVQKRLTPGSVIVLHANGKGKHTREVTEALAGNLLGKKGLRAMTVSDLLQCNQPTSDPTH